MPITNEYTSQDAGCYVDGARGIYATDAIVRFAESHGFKLQYLDGQLECGGDIGEHMHDETCDQSRFAGCEFSGEVEEEATDYMNNEYVVENCYWGRNENSDWGLWEVEEE